MKSILESTSGGLLGPPGPLLGGSCTSFGRLLDALEALLGILRGLLGCSWDALVRSWAGVRHILVLLGASGPLWGRPGRSQEAPETLFGTILGPSGDDLGTIVGDIWEQLVSYLVMLFLPCD